MDTPVNIEKAKALQAALAQIEKQFGKGTIMRLGEGEVIDDIEVVSTGSLGLDIALGVGGLPRGRVVEIYGPESSGKTTLTLQVIAEMQKAGGTCAFMMPNMHSTSNTPKIWVSTCKSSLSASQTRVSRRWKLSMRWYALLR
jgi:protein RecA